MNELNISTEMMATKDLRNKLGVYFSIHELNGLDEPWDEKNKYNFLKLLNINFFLRPKEDKINFVLYFLNKSYKNKTVKVFEKLNADYYDWFSYSENKNMALTFEGATLLIEKKIEEIINEVIHEHVSYQNKIKKHAVLSFIDNFVCHNFNKKLNWIIKNKDIYKGKLAHFITLQLYKSISVNNNVEIKVPSFVKEKDKDFIVYVIKGNKIIEISNAYLFKAEFDKNNNSLSVKIEFPENEFIHNFQILRFDDEKNCFIFDDERIFGTKKEAELALKNMIEKMENEISNMKKQVA